MKSAGLGYEQGYVGVEINTNDENTKIDVLQPLKTLAFDQETKEVTANNVTISGSAEGSVGFLNPMPTMSLSGSSSREASSSTECKRYHSRITDESSNGVVSWGFFVNDSNERESGIRFGSPHRALPSVNFRFRSNIGPPPPPPEHFDVLVTSCWSLISPGGENYTTSGWFSWLKEFSQGTVAASEIPLCSNLCQIVRLEVPSRLSQSSFHRSVLEVNQSGGKVVAIKEQGLYNIIPAVKFLNAPIRCGKPLIRRVQCYTWQTNIN